MKGKLKKNEYGEWVVVYHPLRSKGIRPFNPNVDVKELQLYPDDVNWIHNNMMVFDNIEARIKADPEVEFEIVEHQKMDEVVKYAKLKNEKD